MLCDYGCNEKSNFTLKNGKKCCSKHYSSCKNVRKKNSLSIKEKHRKGLLYSFTKEDIDKSNMNSIFLSEKKALVKNSNYSNEFIKKIFIRKLEKYECNICKISEWNNNPITLELDHINGDNKDNRLVNLRLLCPNCHSQTENFRGRNINNGDKKVSDETFLKVLKESKNIRQALIKLGLTPKGKNYERAYKLQNLSG